MIEVLFWLCFAVLVYAITGYPICLFVLSKLFGKEPDQTGPRPGSFTFLIAAYNEEAIIRDKVENCLLLADGADVDVQVVVVSDASADRTVEIVSGFDDPRIQLVDRAERSGKALALNGVLSLAKNEIVIFTDANSMVEPGALEAMSDLFSDPEIGGICGKIAVDTSDSGAIGKGESFYWSYDQSMKRAETRLGGAVSAQGSFYAIRQRFVGPLRPDCADDFFNSVRVVAMGSRLAYSPRVRAVEHVTEQARREMSRRIRSTERGWRALLSYSRLMNPFKHGWYAWQLFSHKFLRRLIPFVLLLFFFLSLAVMTKGPVYAAIAWFQIAAYAIVFMAVFSARIRRFPLVKHVFFFAMANFAMGFGLVRYLLGHRSTLWSPVRD